MSTAPDDFRTFVAKLIHRHGTARVVANAIEMSESAFSRGVRNEGTLSVDNLLRLAEWAGEDPSNVLRIAGKAHTADRIERLYGPAREPLTRLDRELIALPPGVKEQALRFIKELTPRRRNRA